MSAKKRATLWKSMKSGLRSDNGDIGPWKVGEWRKHNGELTMCESGFHASENVIDAMRYVDAEVIAKVEVRGEHLEQDDKQVWSEMRIVRAWTWAKEDSVSLAVYAAELVIGEYEKYYPDNDRPRAAIEAAKAWLKDPSVANQDTAGAAARVARAAAEAAARVAAGAIWAAAEAAAEAAAGAARAAAGAAAGAAEAAAGAARAAARAARAAAGAARAAAWAAWAAAEAAAEAAAGAAWAAASKDIVDKCHAFVLARLATKGIPVEEEEK